MPCDGSVVTNMRPQDVLLEHANGDEEAPELGSEEEEGAGEGGEGNGAGDEEDEEEELLLAGEHAARLLERLNALRKSRQHYDVLLTACDGAELAAHGAVLAAASPRLLALLGAAPHAAPPGSRALRLDVPGDALGALLDAVYTGRLRVPPASARALALCAAAAELRLDAARDALLRRLLRRLEPHAALLLRALPQLPPAPRQALDDYIAAHFDAVCSSGALAALPVLRLEVQRECGAAAGGAAGLAAAALRWLRAAPHGALAALCARTHQLYVDGDGALQECGTAGAAGAGGGARGEWAVVAARGDAHSTRALLALPGALLLARVALRRGARGAGGGAEGGAARVAALAAGRCAFGAGVLGGRLLVCGGYDATAVLAATAAYCPRRNAWARLADMRGARARFGAACLGEALYAVGGSDGHAELASVEALRGGAWRAVAALPAAAAHGAAVGAEGEAGGGAGGAGGRLLLVGGWAAGRSLRAVRSYSPTEDKWTEIASLNTARSQCAGAWWRGAAWAIGGADDWRCLASTEVLWGEGRAGGEDEADSEARGEGAAAGGAWRAGPALLTARRAAGVAAWRARLWAAGGSDGAASLSSTEFLESPGGPWRYGPGLRRARAAAALAALGDALYCVGGYSGRDFLACLECLYDPAGPWTELARAADLTPVAAASENGEHEDEAVEPETTSGKTTPADPAEPLTT